ncbi:DYW family of nucleic acid deaminases domain containing protein [Rhypophila sp. PSN 637]
MQEESQPPPKVIESTATTVVFNDTTMNTIEYVLSRMVLGDCEYVRRYLDKSAAAVLFLRGVEATIVRLKPNDPEDWEEEEKDEDGWITWTTVTGKTALHFASGEIHPDIVELLLERGADPNVREAEGHTPLSEAALWGRLENVKLLLNYGANPLLACIRDGKRALAVDFAKNDEVNAQKRDAISPMIQFTRAMTPGNFLTLVALFDVPNKWKTVGVLWRGSSFPPEDPVANFRISGEEYTDAAWELCSYIGHDLAPYYHDQARPGQFHACHAEKQLIAYFVSRHVFLHHETSEGWAESGAFLEAPVPPVVKSKLSDHQPPVSLREATVMVSSPQCWDCQLFVARLNEVLGLQITVVAGGVV